MPILIFHKKLKISSILLLGVFFKFNSILMVMRTQELEVWKDIIGYENLYQISSLGNVKSLGNGKSNNSKERKKKPQITKDGYYQVGLSKEGKQKTYKVHRLVAQAFLPNPDNYPCVNHLNEGKTDNRVNNLEWVTIKQNCNYGTRNERIGKTSKGRTHTQETKDIISQAKSIPIIQIHQSGLIVGVYDSARQAGNELGIYHSNISNCLKGKRKSAGGFKFKYLNELEKKAS